jgi:Zn-dependent protease with chaperone function
MSRISIDPTKDKTNFILTSAFMGAMLVGTTLLLNEPVFTGIFSAQALWAFRKRYKRNEDQIKKMKASAILPQEYKAVLPHLDRFSKEMGIKTPALFVQDTGGPPGAVASGNREKATVLLRNLSGYTAEKRDFVLGHEVAHLAEDHSAKSAFITVMKGVALGNLAQWGIKSWLHALHPQAGTVLDFLPSIPGNPWSAVPALDKVMVGAAVAYVGMSYAHARYNHSKEFFADRVGAHFAGPRAGIDVLRDCQVWDALCDTLESFRNPLKATRLHRWASETFESHPPEEKRIKALMRLQRRGERPSRLER